MGTDSRTGTGAAGARLVLIHGSGDSARCWRDMLHALGWDASRVVALDLPGHGQRLSEPLPAPPSVIAYAAAVRGDLAARGAERVTLVGHSLGSAIALRLALDTPELVERLVLIGAGARLRVSPALLETARTQPAAAWKEIVAQGHAPDHQDMVEPYVAASAPVAHGALYNDLTACDGFDIMGQLGSVAQPTLALVGDADRLAPPRYATYLVEHLPRATLATIPGAGHYLMNEAPLAVARALRAWLEA
jgi:pimeloyl-ACP methyl ester carboxylesterase